MLMSFRLSPPTTSHNHREVTKERWLLALPAQAKKPSYKTVVQYCLLRWPTVDCGIGEPHPSAKDLSNIPRGGPRTGPGGVGREGSHCDASVRLGLDLGWRVHQMKPQAACPRAAACEIASRVWTGKVWDRRRGGHLPSMRSLGRIQATRIGRRGRLSDSLDACRGKIVEREGGSHIGHCFSYAGGASGSVNRSPSPKQVLAHSV